MEDPFKAATEDAARKFAENMKAKKDAKALYRRIALRLHDDKFSNGNLFSGETRAEALALWNRFKNIYDGPIKNPNKDNLNADWRGILEEMNNIEFDIEQFLQKAEAERAANENAASGAGSAKPGPDAGKKKGNASEWREFQRKFVELRDELIGKMKYTDLGDDLMQEQDELVKEINVLFNDSTQGSWEKRLKKLQDIAIRVEEFLKRAEMAQKDGMYGEVDREWEAEEKRREEERKARKDSANADTGNGVEAENEELIEIEKQLDDARRLYVIKSNVAKRFSPWYKKLSGFGKGPNLGKFQEELDDAENIYKEALKKYKDYLIEIEMNKPKGTALDADGNEILDNSTKKGAEKIAKYFKHEEFLKVDSVRNEIMVENRSWPEMAKRGYIKMLEGYSKLPLKQKLIIGAALAGVGLVTGAWAGAAAGAAVMTVRRVFSVSIASKGWSNAFEGLAENSREKNANKNVAEMTGKVEANAERAEFDFEAFKGLLDEDIEKVNSEIDSRDLGKKWRGYGAIAAGVGTSLLGSYIGKLASPYVSDAIKFWSGGGSKTSLAGGAIDHASERMHHMNEAIKAATKGVNMEKVEITGGDGHAVPTFDSADHVSGGAHNVRETAGFGVAKDPKINGTPFGATTGPGIVNVQEILDKSAAVAGSTAKESAVEKIHEVVSENIFETKKITDGVPVQKLMREFYAQHPDIAKAFQDSHENLIGKKLTPGQLAHIAWLESVDKHDLVHAGADVNFTHDGRILSITNDPKMAYFQHDAAGHVTGHTTNYAEVSQHAAGGAGNHIDSVHASDAAVAEAIKVDIPHFTPESIFANNDIFQIDKSIDLANGTLSRVDNALLAAYHQINPNGNLKPEEIMKLDVDKIQHLTPWAVPKTPELVSAENNFLKHLIEQRKSLSEEIAKLYKEKTFTEAINVRRYLGGESSFNWSLMSGQPAKDLLDSGKDARVNSFFEYLTKFNGSGAEKLKEIAVPNDGETVNAWATRIVKRINVLGIKI